MYGCVAASGNRGVKPVIDYRERKINNTVDELNKKP